MSNTLGMNSFIPPCAIIYFPFTVKKDLSRNNTPDLQNRKDRRRHPPASRLLSLLLCLDVSSHSRQNKNQPQFRSEYNVYSTFQSHEPEFDYLKSLEIEEKINKIRWLPQKNAAQFLLSTNGELPFTSLCGILF